MRKIDQMLLWLDLETTGLDPEGSDRILEVYACVTDKDLNVIDDVSAVVHQPDELLLKMDDWCKKTHWGSGLVQEVRKSTISEQEAERMVCGLIAKYFTGKPVLAGSSIHFDRRFIRKYWKTLDQTLHYRMHDTTSGLEQLRVRHGFEFPKRDEPAHRAKADVERSIELARKIDLVLPFKHPTDADYWSRYIHAVPILYRYVSMLANQDPSSDAVSVLEAFEAERNRPVG